MEHGRLIPAVPVLRKLRQEDRKLQPSLTYTARLELALS